MYLYTPTYFIKDNKTFFDNYELYLFYQNAVVYQMPKAMGDPNL